MARSRVKHGKPVMGLLYSPYRETGMPPQGGTRGGLCVLQLITQIMLNFFHSIAGKIAIAISSIVLLFSGAPASTQLAVQNGTSSVQVSQQPSAASTTGLSEVEQLRNEIKALKSKPAPTVDTTNKPAASQSKGVAPIQTSQKVSVPAQIATQTTSVKLSNLNPYIEELVANYETNLVYVNAALKSVDFYDDNFNKARVLISMLMDSEADAGLKKAYGLVKTDLLDKQIAYNAKTREVYLSNKAYILDTIPKLKADKESNAVEGSVSLERYLSDMKGVAGIFDVVDKLGKSMTSFHENYLSDTEKFQSDLKFYLDMIRAKVDANHAALMNSYNSIINDSHAGAAYQPINIYQPVAYPPIRMPQTTHCTISGDGGVGLEAYFSCTTSSF